MNTLNFTLSDEQQSAISKAASSAGKADTSNLESSFRAWNAAFVDCNKPLESSYRAWNAAFVSCDTPV